MPIVNLEDAFVISVPADSSQPGYSEDWLEAEVAKAWLINSAVFDFLESGIDEETFLDILEACDQDMDQYVKVASENLYHLLNS